MTPDDPDVPRRGHVYFAEIPNWGDRPVVVVSNDARNRALNDVLVAKITNAPKPSVPSVVALPEGEPVVGRVMCDDITGAPKRALRRHVGRLSRSTMLAVDDALRVALGLRRLT
jgi:mRNA interferase MazF